MSFDSTFSIDIPYDKDCLQTLSSIMGRFFSKKTKKWEFPSTEIFVLANRIDEHFPEVSKKLLRSNEFKKDRDIAANDEKYIALSRAKRVRFEPPVPNGMKYLPHQKAGIYYGIQKDRSYLLIADEMGLGKTIETIGIANYHGFKKCLFITPNSAKLNWQREIKKWSTITDNVGVLDGKSTKRDIEYYDYMSVNYEALKNIEGLLLDFEWDMVAGDEAHMIKNKDSQRAKSTKNLCEQSLFRLLLTGSPIVNRPHEMWNILNILNPLIWANWYDFIFQFCGAKKDDSSLYYKGMSNPDDFQRLVRKTTMLRRLKKEVLKDLPPKTRTIVEIPATSKFSSILRAQEKYIGAIQSVAEVLDNVDISNPEKAEDDFRKKLFRVGKLTPQDYSDIMMLRHKTALLKAPEVTDFAKELLETKSKIGIYAHHIDVQDYFIKAFGKQCVSIPVRGKDTLANRQRAVDRFQNDPSCRVFVGSIMAAGTNITLTASDVCIMAEMDWVPGINIQVEDRFHRIGTISNVMIYYAMLSKSVDYYIAQMMIEKLEMAESMLDKKLNLKPKSKLNIRKRIIQI